LFALLHEALRRLPHRVRSPSAIGLELPGRRLKGGARRLADQVTTARAPIARPAAPL